MKRAFFAMFIFACNCIHAQINLVLNPSFELFDSCPNNYDQIKFSSYWQSLDSSWVPWDFIHDPPGVPDYCNACASNITVSVPSNALFYHYPRTGNGMAQVQMYWSVSDTGDAHDYLQGHLSQTLIAGHTYAVTFFTVLEDYVFGINHIGAYFDDGTIDTTHQYGVPQTQYTPQILDTAIITDTFNWTKIQGTFVANGTERLITIGNFQTGFIQTQSF